MAKKIFSIICTTCQARLAVRSESAIGAVFECPRCQSMVQVTPPPGWVPAAPPPQTTSTGPPPLDRVADVLQTLELEPAAPSLLSTLLPQHWLLWGVASTAACATVVVLSWLAFSRPEPEIGVVETKIGFIRRKRTWGLKKCGHAYPIRGCVNDP